MSDSSSLSSASRPRPVLYAQLALAALGVVTGAAGFTEHIPADIAWWLVTGIAAANAAIGFYLQGVVTPLSDPRDANGNRLTPEGS